MRVETNKNVTVGTLGTDAEVTVSVTGFSGPVTGVLGASVSYGADADDMDQKAAYPGADIAAAELQIIGFDFSTVGAVGVILRNNDDANDLTYDNINVTAWVPKIGD